MITYKKISNRDDKKFHRIARKVLGAEYGNACHEANEAFLVGYKSGTETTRNNCARRAANLVILRWLADYGVQDWTNIDAPKVKRAPVKNAQRDFVSDKVKDRKFNSSDGLWSNKIT